MRVSLFALALVVATCAAPTALASRATLALEAPEGPAATGGTFPLTIHLHVQDFMCHEERAFFVALSAVPTAGVTVKLETDNVSLHVPARAYFSETYSASGVVNVTLAGGAPGEVNVTATFEADRGPCFVPGGFAPASANLTLRVEPGAAPTQEPAPTTDEGSGPAPTESEPPANETDPTSPSPPPSPDTTPEPKPEAVRNEDCDGLRCGYIGDFVPPTSESRNESPLPGGALLVAALGALALARRKR